MNNGSHNTMLNDDTWTLIQEDLRLADHLHPTPCAHETTQVVLVTGATGFFGRHLVRELLRNPALHILCLIRADNLQHAEQRLLDSMNLGGPYLAQLPERLQAVCGDITTPYFGLTDGRYAELAQQVDTLYHGAAEVNWVRNYERLRPTNVLGTVELIRFACAGRTKKVIFLSSLAVCFAKDVAVDESTNMQPFIRQMPMGYAQSKCVAECLLRSVAQRGLPVNIVRAGLIAGDTMYGASNPSDLVAAMIQGAVSSGVAIDADWLIDTLPVDYVAQAIMALPTPTTHGHQTFHLNHPRPRHWREIVLWLNLYGYPIQLLPTEDWIAASFSETSDFNNPIYPLRRFFTQANALRMRPFEAYLADDQRKISSEKTRNTLPHLPAPDLDSGLLHLYLGYYQTIQKLPPVLRKSNTPAAAFHPNVVVVQLGSLLQRHFSDPQLSVHTIEEQAFGSANGILNEISSVRLGTKIGIRRYNLSLMRGGATQCERLSVLVKTKASDREMQELIAYGAGVCDPLLGEHFSRYSKSLGLENSHLRELALYEWNEPTLRGHTPICYGCVRDDALGLWSLVLEYVDQVDTAEITPSMKTWQPQHIEACIDGLAAVHGLAYQRQDKSALPKQLCVSTELSTEETLEMTPLWKALAGFSGPYFQTWLGPSIVALQGKLIAELSIWWPQLAALPQTLVHNDFNPRNLVLRNTQHGQRLCAFDWELACLGVPQRDLAELLCFTWIQPNSQQQLMGYLERHRQALQASSGTAIDALQWRLGFKLSLQNLLLNRLPTYTLFHRFKQQDFLPIVMSNWAALYAAMSRS